MDGEVAILDHDLGPELGVEGLAVDQPALGLDQQAQHIERLAGDRPDARRRRVTRRSGVSRMNEPNAYNAT